MLWATEPCFLLDQEILAEPRQKQYPDVLFWSTALPIQSESVKQHTSTGCVSETIRYILSNISTAIMCISLGSHMNQLRAFIATGQVLVKYIKDPKSCLYMMGIIESDFESESFSFFRLAIIRVDILLLFIMPNLCLLHIFLEIRRPYLVSAKLPSPESSA